MLFVLLFVVTLGTIYADNITCPQVETKCGQVVGCGWCITADYDGSCVRGDLTGAFDKKIVCARQWSPARVAAPHGIMVCGYGARGSPIDVRCYTQCAGMDGRGNTTNLNSSSVGLVTSFPVPDNTACNTYESAFGAAKLDIYGVSKVWKSLVANITYNATVTALKNYYNAKKLYEASTNKTFSNGFTRSWIGDVVGKFAERGFDDFSDSVCEYFDGDEDGYCHTQFYDKTRDYAYNKIQEWPYSNRMMSRVSDAAYEYVPEGMSSGMDGLASAAEEYGAGAVLEEAASTFGGYLVDGLFGLLLL